jgi:hypothetical protein
MKGITSWELIPYLVLESILNEIIEEAVGANKA